MIDSQEPKPVLPVLAPLYKHVVPLAWPLVRFAVGLNLIIHGWPKIFRPPSALAPVYAQIGFEPAIVWAFASTWLEFAGGIAILLGLFTRFFAAAVAIEMLFILFLYWNNGFSWLNRGYEYVLLWGLISFAIALRGGGPYSIDRKIGREL